MKTHIYLIAVILGAGLTACSSLSVQNHSSQLIAVEKTEHSQSALEAEIKPYRDSVEWEMGIVIAHADTNFIPERPSGNLNNWAADALLTNQIKNIRLTAPVICLLNTGGLRTTINKGDVTIGDFYKIMPFDNLVVWTRMPVSVIPEIAEYLIKTGGEPIAGAKLENGKLQVNGVTEKTTEIIVITSDYLVNGGDKMYFFQKAIEVIHTGKLIRDCIVTEAKEQGTLISDPTQRIVLK